MWWAGGLGARVGGQAPSQLLQRCCTCALLPTAVLEKPCSSPAQPSTPCHAINTTSTPTDNAPAAAGGGASVAHTQRRDARRLSVLHPQGRGGVGEQGEERVALLR